VAAYQADALPLS